MTGRPWKRYEGMTLADRVRLRITVEQASDLVDTPCWLWQGGISQGLKGGYGMIRPIGPQGLAPARVHGVMYEDAYGPPPEGLVLDHLCGVRRCCNPEHLEAVTQKVNLERAGIQRDGLGRFVPKGIRDAA